MLDKEVDFEERDLSKHPLSEAELDALIGDTPITEFLNTRNDLYRSMKMRENPPTRAKAIKLMAGEPNLMKRPIFIRGTQKLLGFDAEQVARLL